MYVDYTSADKKVETKETTEILVRKKYLIFVEEVSITSK